MNIKVERCEACGKILAPLEAVLCAHKVCRECVDKRHREVTRR